MNYIKIIFTLSIVSLLFFSCSDIPDNDVYPASFKTGETPVITEINPPDSTLAGVGTIEILGQHFSANIQENLVYFDAVRANVLEASETRLLVASPNLAKEVKIKVATLNADLYSDIYFKLEDGDTVYYKLKPAVASIGNILTGASADEIYGLAVDTEENVYIYIGRLGDARAKLKKITPLGETETLSETLQFDRPNAMRMGPDGLIYIAVYAGRVRGIFTLDQAGVSTSFASTETIPQDMDFDEAGNLWVAAQENVIRISADASQNEIVETVEVDNLTAVRVYDGYLYYAGNDGAGMQKIWKSEIQGNILGARDTVLNVANTTFPQEAAISAITFSADGLMYISFSKQAKDLENAVYTYDDASGESILYEGLISSDIEAMAWGNNTKVYAVQQYFLTVEGASKIHSQVFRIDVGEQGAPYYGRN